MRFKVYIYLYCALHIRVRMPRNTNNNTQNRTGGRRRRARGRRNPRGRNTAIPNLPFQCNECSRRFASMAAAVNHERFVHGENTPNMVSTRKPRPRRRAPGSAIPSGGMFAKAGIKRGDLSVAAEEWALRALSPCDERLGGTQRIPDMGIADSAGLTQRIINVITAPTAVGDDKTWDLLIYVPPLPDVAFVYKAWSSSADPTTVSWKSVSYKDILGSTAYLPHWDETATRLAWSNKPGTLISNVEQFRQTHKGLTIQLNGNALTNQGMVLAGQYGDRLPIESDYPLLTEGGSTADPAGRAYGSVIKMLDVPLSTDEIYAKDPAAMRGPARDGAYLALKFNGPVQEYSPARSTETYSNDGTTVLQNPQLIALPVVLTRFRPTTNDYVEEFLTLNTGVNENEVVTSVGTTNLQTGVALFSGIDRAASIDVKVVSGLEIVASGSSPFSGFMEPPLEESDTAQRQVHLMQRRLASAYPAKYNVLGTLIATVLPALGSVAVSLVKGWWTRFTDRASAAANV